MQEAPSMHRSYESWTSPNLGRQMEFLWFGWGGYPVLVFPTSMGRFFQYEDTGLVGRLAHKMDAGLMQLVCVDSVDSESWYNDSIEPALRGARHERYDAYLRDELVPYVQKRADRHDVGVFGCSFGGYHAANFAGRHPDVVSKAVCLSGVYDVRRFTDGYWDHTDYANSPADYIADLDPAAVARLRNVDWVLATGEYDELAGDHRRFDRVLTEKGIPHHGELWPGINGHDWPFWNDAVERLL
jgi:esterase/lipase superfamily enzyme